MQLTKKREISVKMTLLSWLVNTVFSDWTSFITCLVIGWGTYKCSKFYYRVWSLPRGPFPLPVIGNLLMFRGSKCNNVITLTEMSEKYGPIFTFWVGNLAFIFVSDLELSKELFKKSEFAGRPPSTAFDLMKGKNNERSDIIMDQFGHRWESNRRVAHAAVRKYAVSDKLPILVYDVIDEIVNDIIQKEGIGKPFDPELYVKSIYLIILANSAYSMDEPEIAKIIKLQEYMQDPRFALLEFVPLLRMFNKKFFETVVNSLLELSRMLKEKFNDHLKDFDENQIRDFCDALLLAKKEAIADAKETAQYLTDDNLGLAIFDLFFAGSDTSQFTTRWIILYLANFSEHQQKLREEVASIIGDRMPVQDDRNECHQVNAFIHEVMRCRPVAPLAVPHFPMVDTKIGDYFIPQNGAGIFQNIYAIHHNPKNFPEPDQFKPERFLDSSGRFLTQKPAAFIPFGTGRRVGLGERLAIADIFLVVVNLLQKTSGYKIVLANGPGTGDLEMDLVPEGSCSPRKFEIVLKKVAA